MICSEEVLVKNGGEDRLVSILRCKRWSCPLCQPFNRLSVIGAARRGHPDMFITLTVNPARYASPDAAARDLKRSFVLLRRAIFKRYQIKNIPFLAVFERTKAGWPHLHVLARARWIDQKWLSDEMRRLIDAPIVDVRRVQDQGRAAAYVAKYVGKDPHAFNRCKRWWRSRNFEVDPDDFEPIMDRCIEWWTSRDSLAAKIEAYSRQGFRVVKQGSNFAFMTSRLPP